LVELKVRFEVDDVELSALHSAAFGTAKGHVTQWAGRLARRSLTWVGAFEDGGLVGFAQVLREDPPILVDVAVHPDHQGRGIGKTVVEAVVGEAFATGCEAITTDHEPHLTGFYERCGFRNGTRQR
jgi:GNAT superfamily N-acetyltransferase